jgi:hypothetical protein
MRSGLRPGAAAGLVLAAGGATVAATSAFSDPSDPSGTDSLYRGDTKVGKDGGWCVATRLTEDGAATFECLGANSLPGGQITVQGLVTYGPGEEVKRQP